MKYINKFKNNAAYQAYADSAEYVEPHVSLSVEENEVHFNKPPKKPKWIATYQDGHTASAECDDTGEIVVGEITLVNLVSVEIKDCVTSIGSIAFQGCSGLTSIDIPDSVATIGNRCFNNCSGLASLNIPSGVTTFSYNAFNGCASLNSITVDSNNTVLDSRNNCNAIMETATNELCQGSNNTIIPNDTVAIKDAAFAYLTELTSLTIPEGVGNVGRYFCQDCANLTSVTLLSTTPPSAGTNLFYACTKLNAIYVPAESVDAYKSADKWSSFASKIQPIV